MLVADKNSCYMFSLWFLKKMLCFLLCPNIFIWSELVPSADIEMWKKCFLQHTSGVKTCLRAQNHPYIRVYIYMYTYIYVYIILAKRSSCVPALQHVSILRHHKGRRVSLVARCMFRRRSKASCSLETATVGFSSLVVMITNHVKLLLCHLRWEVKWAFKCFYSTHFSLRPPQRGQHDDRVFNPQRFGLKYLYFFKPDRIAWRNSDVISGRSFYLTFTNPTLTSSEHIRTKTHHTTVLAQ